MMNLLITQHCNYVKLFTVQNVDNVYLVDQEMQNITRVGLYNIEFHI